MKRHITFSLALFVAAWSLPAAADFDLRSYKELSESEPVKEKLSDYVAGLGRGVVWTNIAFQVAGQNPLFCMPEKLAADQGLIESLLSQEIRNPASGKPYADDTPIELIMIRAFVSRFPCEPAA